MAWVTAGFSAPGLTFRAGRYAPAGPSAAGLFGVAITGLALTGAAVALGVGVGDRVGDSLAAAAAERLGPAVVPLAVGSQAVRLRPRSTVVPRTASRVLMI